jgi:hypothetical protein
MILPCRAAVAAGCDGIFVETHPRPTTRWRRAEYDSLDDLPDLIRLSHGFAARAHTRHIMHCERRPECYRLFSCAALGPPSFFLVVESATNVKQTGPEGKKTDRFAAAASRKTRCGHVPGGASGD